MNFLNDNKKKITGTSNLCGYRVNKVMNISKYTSYFHDGDINEIVHRNDEIVLTMESAEMDPEEIDDPNILSKDDRLKGKLHIEGIKTIIIDKKSYLKPLRKIYDRIEVLDFVIEDERVELFVELRNTPTKQSDIEYSSIEIEAEKIYWENIPSLPL